MALLPDTLSGHQPSALGLGTWVLGGGRDWGEVSSQTAEQTLLTALEAGINFIDTAPAYGWGLCEERVGQVVKNCRKQIFLATKCGICLNESARPDHDLTPRRIIAECEESLRRLQTDYIDLYQVHWPDSKIPLEDTLETLVCLKQQGKIRSIGLCNFSEELFQKACSLTDISCAQYPFSLLDATAQNLKNLCQKEQIAFVGYGVLAGGILSGKYKKEPNFRRCDARRYFYKHYVGESFEKASKVVQRVSALAQQKQVSSSCVALAWALGERGVRSILAGARTAEQVRQNIQALQIVLTEQEREFLRHG